MTDIAVASPPNFPPRMIAVAEEPRPFVRRITEADLDEIAWAATALLDRWPRANTATWFRQLLYDGRSMFVRTDNVVALADFDRTPKEPGIVVCENFFRHNGNASGVEPIEIHKHFLEWAVSLGAVAYRFKIDSPGCGTEPKIKEMVREHGFPVSTETSYISRLKE